MKLGYSIACLSLLAVSLQLTPSVLANPEPLFNGRDLSGWVVMHGGEWSVDEGVLVGRNGANWTTNPEQSGSWLRTEKEYGDFVLELEYAISAKGNSGIHFRAALEKNPSFTGYEMQILDDAKSEPRRYNTGSLYDVVAPTKNMSKPAGEWNRVRITCKGAHIQVNLNGEDVVNFSTANRANRGYIGLQNHDERSVVKFRNIKITPL